MKKLLVFLMMVPYLLLAQEINPWTDISSTNMRVADKWQEVPSTKKQLNNEVLNEILKKVRTYRKATIAIPTPEGSDSYFEITESSVMAPKLQAKYPNIKAYKGINEQGERIRLNVGINGFRATIFSDQGAYGINPESTNSDVYVSYRWADYNRVNDVISTLSCGAESNKETETMNPSSARTTAADFTSRRTGDFHTKLRLAIIPDLNYVDHFGGTVEGALSGIATTVNTVNEIYERDASISFELVENNDAIIYTDRSDYQSEAHYETVNNYNLDSITDLLNELIGVDNYDIGHHFLMDWGGGIAAASSVCKDNDKAKGVSGRSLGPEGYVFDVSVFSHELGHQLGAFHTFAAQCGTSHSPDDAYEIGSGVTIMGYGFGCAGFNHLVYPNFDYFNARSIEKIIRTIENNCGELIVTGNTPPTVSIPESGFTIPINTPFVLEADGNDADGDAITYCWEQYDRATKVENVRYAAIGEDGEVFETVEEYQAYTEQFIIDLVEDLTQRGFDEDVINANINFYASGHQLNIERFWEGDGPLFRSFNPTENNKRYFPELSKVIDGTADQLSFEVMPHKTRDLNFVVTVRDNSTRGAGIASDIVSFSSSDQAGPFIVSTLFVDPSYNGLSNVTLEWEVANTDSDPVNCQAVDILYSTNGGESFDIVLVKGAPNDGSEVIKLPNLATSEARIMVKAADNIFFNVNDRDFAITASEVDIASAPTALMASRLDDGSVVLSWSHSGELEDGFIVERQTGTNSEFVEIVRTTVNATTYRDQTTEATESYIYRVSAFNITGNSEYSNTVTINANSEVLSISDHSPIAIYPNPASDHLLVNSDETQLAIISVLGKVFQKKIVDGRIDVSDLSSGVYFIQAQQQFIRFIKE